MSQSDLDLLLEMGFEKDRAQMAVQKPGGLQGALEWLEKNQDTPMDDLKAQIAAPAAEGDENDINAEPAALQPGEVARSLVCDDCGKRFRSEAQAEFHASKTEHQNFSQSTEEIKPLTEEEKAQRLKDLKEKLAAKRATQSVTDKEEQKKNEQIRRKHDQESRQIKEDLQKREMQKEAEKKKREKRDEIAAKERIRAEIKATQDARRETAAKAKAEREGRAFEQQSQQTATVPGNVPTASKPAAAYTETRLRLQLATGNVQKVFSVDTTLFEVASLLEQETGTHVTSFTINFPKKTFSEGVEFGQTLKEAGLVPSAALIVK